MQVGAQQGLSAVCGMNQKQNYLSSCGFYVHQGSAEWGYHFPEGPILFLVGIIFFPSGRLTLLSAVSNHRKLKRLCFFKEKEKKKAKKPLSSPRGHLCQPLGYVERQRVSNSLCPQGEHI